LWKSNALVCHTLLSGLFIALGVLTPTNHGQNSTKAHFIDEDSGIPLVCLDFAPITRRCDAMAKDDKSIRAEPMRFWGAGYDVPVTVPNWPALLDELTSRFTADQGFSLATINLDHLVKLRSDPRFREAYGAQDMVVADGNPIVWLSRLAGHDVDLIPGSDAILPITRLAADHRRTIALVGSTEEALTGARTYLEREVPGARVVATIAPCMGFDPTGASADDVLARLEGAGADLAYLALGAPKQELFAAYGRRKLPSVGFVSIGAGLDFFAGTQVRAPRWVRAIAMEWVWRVLQHPRRMVPRYAKCGLILPAEAAHALALRIG